MRRLLMFLAVLHGAAMAASAATVPYRSDGELVAISHRVVRGRVLDSVAERAPSGTIRTRTRVAVIEDFSGGIDPIVTVYEHGGRLTDGAALWIPGAPRFVTGDDVVLCLERTGDGFRTVSMAFSAFRVGGATAGERRLTRFDGVSVVGSGSGPGGRRAVEASRTLPEFRVAASTATGVASRAILSEAAAAAAVVDAARGRVDDRFTLLGDGFRWPAGRCRYADHVVSQYAAAIAGPGGRHRYGDSPRAVGMDRSAGGIDRADVRRHPARSPGGAARSLLRGGQPRCRPDHVRRSPERAVGRRPRHRRRLRDPRPPTSSTARSSMPSPTASSC